jgi:hypothetical protein
MEVKNSILMFFIAVALGMLLFPRRVMTIQWQFFAWIVAKNTIGIGGSDSRYLLSNERLEQYIHEPRNVRQYQFGAFFMLIAFISAIYWL